MKNKYNVLLTDSNVVTLLLDKEELENLKYEFTGKKSYMQEYKTTEGEIITDIDIVRLF